MHAVIVTFNKSSTFMDAMRKALTTSINVMVGGVSFLAGWLVFNGTFSTTRLYRPMQKVKDC